MAAPCPPLRQHLPINALAHLTLLFPNGLSRLPLIVHAPLPAGTDIPPTALMRPPFVALWKRAKAILLEEWKTHHPTLPHYTYHRSFSPYPFMGFESSWRAEFTKCVPERATSLPTAPGLIKTNRTPAPDAIKTKRPSSMPSSNAAPTSPTITSW